MTVNGEWSLPALTWTDEPYITLYCIVLYLLYYLIVFIILFHYIYYIISLYLLLLLWYYIYLILLYYLHLTLYYLHLIQLRIGRIGQLLWALVSSQAVAEAVLFKLLYEKKNLSIKTTLSAVYWFVSFPQILLSSAIHHSAAFSPKAIDLSMAWEAEGCWAEWLLWWNCELWGNIQLVKHIIDLLSSVDLSLPVDPQLRQHLLFKVQPLFCHPKRFWSTEIGVCAQVHIPRTFLHSLIHMKKKERKFSFLNLRQFSGRDWELHSSASHNQLVFSLKWSHTKAQQGRSSVLHSSALPVAESYLQPAMDWKEYQAEISTFSAYTQPGLLLDW